MAKKLSKSSKSKTQKTAAKKVAAKNSKTPVLKKKAVKKVAVKKTLPTKKTATPKKSVAKKAPAKKVAKKSTSKKSAAKKSTAPLRHDLGKGTILVTGGAGFIGSALIAELNSRGYENILVTDFLGSSDRFKNLVPLRFQDYIEADDFLELLADEPSLFDDVHTIFHLGACSSTTETDARYLVQNNYAYTQSLAGWALLKGARFVYASSAATYGDGKATMSDLADLSTLRPLNMYGYSKHLFDLYAARRGWLNDIVGLKYFNVFGPNEGHKGDMRSVVSKAYDQILETGQVKLFKSDHPEYADGEQKRDFLYVKDAVNMTIALAENSAASGLFNIGSGKAHTWNELVFALFKALGKEPSIQYIDMPEALKQRYQYYTCADITRLLKSGYTQSITSLEDAVADYVQNYLVPSRHLGE